MTLSIIFLSIAIIMVFIKNKLDIERLNSCHNHFEDEIREYIMNQNGKIISLEEKEEERELKEMASEFKIPLKNINDYGIIGHLVEINKIDNGYIATYKYYMMFGCEYIKITFPLTKEIKSKKEKK